MCEFLHDLRQTAELSYVQYNGCSDRESNWVMRWNEVVQCVQMYQLSSCQLTDANRATSETRNVL